MFGCVIGAPWCCRNKTEVVRLALPALPDDEDAAVSMVRHRVLDALTLGSTNIAVGGEVSSEDRSLLHELRQGDSDPTTCVQLEALECSVDGVLAAHRVCVMSGTSTARNHAPCDNPCIAAHCPFRSMLHGGVLIR